MINRAQMEAELKLTYPKKTSQITHDRRIYNIIQLKSMIEKSINENKLSYNSLEERLVLYTTSAGEKIIIQYPGKESKADKNNKKIRPFDFRPRIIIDENKTVHDLDFASMWKIFEDIDKDYHLLTKSLGSLFFRMGRMIDYTQVSEEYPYEVVNIVSGEVIKTGKKKLSWYKFTLDSRIIEELNHDVFSIKLVDNTVISFEAFLLFFSLILENEDIKYNYENFSKSKGRIPTSDSMLLLASYFSGILSLSEVLQRFVNGRGVGTCLPAEIVKATSGIIKLVDRKQDVIGLLKSNNIQFNKNPITISGTSIKVELKTKSPKVAILKTQDAENEALLKGKDWIVFDLETITHDDTRYDRLCKYFGEYKNPPMFNPSQ